MSTVSKLELECLEKQTKLWQIVHQSATQKLENFNSRNVESLWKKLYVLDISKCMFVRKKEEEEFIIATSTHKIYI